MGFVVDLLEVVVPGRNRRIAKQRWSARRRMYWFRTEPKIPGLRMRRSGYKVRGDALDEATLKLYELVARKVWEVPPGFVSMVIYWNDRPLEFLNLDKIRRADDPSRYEETTSTRGWPPVEKGAQRRRGSWRGPHENPEFVFAEGDGGRESFRAIGRQERFAVRRALTRMLVSRTIRTRGVYLVLD